MTELELAVVEAMWRAQHGDDADFSKAPAVNKAVYETLMRAAIEAYEAHVAKYGQPIYGSSFDVDQTVTGVTDLENKPKLRGRRQRGGI